MPESRKRPFDELPTFVRRREFPERDRRVQVSLPAWVQVAPDRRTAASIIDLSANGFRLVSDEPLRIGQIVRVLSHKDASRGEICWVAGNEAGGTFTKRSQGVLGSQKKGQWRELGNKGSRSGSVHTEAGDVPTSP
jgi:hypothetical protein